MVFEFGNLDQFVILARVDAADHEVIVDRRSAIARGIEIAGESDAVLLAGKGHENYQVVGDEKRPFDEAVIVKEILEGARGTD